MRYKYKVGDKVYYKTIKIDEVVCKCCGHIEYEIDELETYGEITKRYTDYLMESDSDYNTDLIESEGGMYIVTPSFPEMKPPKRHAIYEINGESVVEYKITAPDRNA